MKNERIAEWLMAAIVLFKDIQKANLKQNAEIQGFLDRLIEELEGKKKEEKKDEEENDPKENGDESKSEKKEEKNGSSSPKKAGRAKPKSSGQTEQPEEDNVGEDLSEAQKKQNEKVKNLMESITEMLQKKQEEAEKEIQESYAAGLAALGGSVPAGVSGEDAPEIDDADGEGSGVGAGNEPVHLGQVNAGGAGPTNPPAGKVWCTVCEEFHDAPEAEKHEADLPF